MGNRYFLIREPHVDWYWTGWGFSTEQKDAIPVPEEVVSCLIAYYSHSEQHPMHIVTMQELSMI